MSVLRRVLGLGLACAGMMVAVHCSADEYVRTKTLFNLADAVRGYLALDANTAAPAISDASSRLDASTYWEIRAVGRHRGYRAHLLVSRGNSRYNDQFLTVDAETGALTMSDDKNAETVKWLVRYAGRFQGYDAYYVQLLGKTEGGFDLSYLGVDENGAVKLQREATDAVQWRLRPTPDLPSEVIR
jgi:hypothetical protein